MILHVAVYLLRNHELASSTSLLYGMCRCLLRDRLSMLHARHPSQHISVRFTVSYVAGEASSSTRDPHDGIALMASLQVCILHAFCF